MSKNKKMLPKELRPYVLPSTARTKRERERAKELVKLNTG